MPGAPRAASASLSEPLAAGSRGWSKRQRLLRTSDFAAFSSLPADWRGARRWIVMSAHIPRTAALREGPARAGAVRFGISIARRHCRRAVARNAVRRVLREAARHAAGALARVAPAQGLDVMVRLRAPLPEPATAGWHEIKAQLRQEADALLAQLRAHLRASGHGCRAARAAEH